MSAKASLIQAVSYIMSLSSINAPMIEVSIIMVAKAATMANLIAVKAAITDASLIIQITFLIVFPFVLLFLFVMLLLYQNPLCLSTPIKYNSNLKK